jgi:hypothetical protein
MIIFMDLAVVWNSLLVVWWIVTEELSAPIFRTGRAGSSETSKTTKFNFTACKTVILIFRFVLFSAVFITNFVAAR